MEVFHQHWWIACLNWRGVWHRADAGRGKRLVPRRRGTRVSGTNVSDTCVPASTSVGEGVSLVRVEVFHQHWWKCFTNTGEGIPTARYRVLHTCLFYEKVNVLVSGTVQALG
ncbi:MAG: hypothetical protein LBK00_09870 [Treponema sp.]|nr:hypothetical protein [Treponema sp.]